MELGMEGKDLFHHTKAESSSLLPSPNDLATIKRADAAISLKARGLVIYHKYSGRYTAVAPLK